MTNCDISIINLVCHFLAASPPDPSSFEFLNEEKSSLLKHVEQLQQTRTEEDVNFIYASMYSFHQSTSLGLSFSIFTHRDGRVLDIVGQHSKAILMCISTEFISYISAPTHLSIFVIWKTCMLICVAQQFRYRCAFLSRSHVTPCHPSIMHEVVDESLCKTCPCQQNLPQHYYLLDTPVYYFKTIMDKNRQKQTVTNQGDIFACPGGGIRNL